LSNASVSKAHSNQVLFSLIAGNRDRIDRWEGYLVTSLHPISLWITGLKRAHNHRDFV
jgi:hypothetical protein